MLRLNRGALHQNFSYAPEHYQRAAMTCTVKGLSSSSDNSAVNPAEDKIDSMAWDIA